MSDRIFVRYQQNNDRGGYNVGDKTSKPFQDEDGQYHMVLCYSRLAKNTAPTELS